MRAFWTILAACVLALPAVAQEKKKKEPSRVLITNVHVWDGTSDTVAANTDVLIEGNKIYGSHLGPFKTPAREDDPPHMLPNFYYDQEQWLRSAQVGQNWTWSALRPHFVVVGDQDMNGG